MGRSEAAPADADIVIANGGNALEVGLVNQSAVGGQADVKSLALARREMS
jgi:hypothetical protein